jgi:predicted nucleotidyltransferase
VEKEPTDPRVKPTTLATRVCATLNAHGVKYLVIGGIACVLHGYVRATTDVDILIERSLDNARRLLEALETVGMGFAREWRPEEVLARPITVIGDDPQVDIFTVAWSVKYDGAVERASTVTVEGVDIPLIGIDDLIETKRTGRPLDAADVEALQEIRRLRGDR